jgi:hypothetical protein
LGCWHFTPRSGTWGQQFAGCYTNRDDFTVLINQTSMRSPQLSRE